VAADQAMSEVGKQRRQAEGCYRVLTVDPSAYSHTYYRDVHYYAMVCPAYCLPIGYDASRHDEEMNMYRTHIV